MLGRISFLFLYLLVNISSILAQVPEWVNEESRRARFPASQYKIGFYSEAKVTEDEKVIDKLKKMAKADLIESIQVSIKSQSSLKIEESKNNSELKNYSEFFVSETVSLAEQDIVGLEISTYYDRKQKRASAFAYVKIQKLKDYYTTIISTSCGSITQKRANVHAGLNSGNFNGVLDDIFDIKALLTKAYFAQSILIALGVNDNHSLKSDEVNEHKSSVVASLYKTLSDPRIGASDILHFFANSIKLQLSSTQGKLQLSKFRYDTYDLYSEFSNFMSKQILSELSTQQTITVVNDKPDFVVSGSFKEVDARIEMEVVIKGAKKGEVMGAYRGSFPKQNAGLPLNEVLPVEITKLRIIKNVSLSTTASNLSFKCNAQVDALIKVKSSMKATVLGTQVKEIPVDFYINSKSNATTIYADETGTYKYVLHSVRSPKKVQFLYARLNPSAYLGMDSTSADYTNLLKDVSIPSVRIQINVSGNVIYISSLELNISKELATPYLHAGIVDALTKVGFEFTTNQAKADYTVTVKANTRAGSSFEELYFSYLDASVTLLDKSTQQEVFSNQYRDIKAAGGNYEGAGVKAYSMGLKTIKEDLVTFFSK